MPKSTHWRTGFFFEKKNQHNMEQLKKTIKELSISVCIILIARLDVEQINLPVLFRYQRLMLFPYILWSINILEESTPYFIDFHRSPYQQVVSNMNQLFIIRFIIRRVCMLLYCDHSKGEINDIEKSMWPNCKL